MLWRFLTPLVSFLTLMGDYAKKIGCIVWDARYNIEIITGAVLGLKRTLRLLVDERKEP